MIVADTNLIAYLLIEGERTEHARQVWARDPDWVVPPLWRCELLNVLATSHRAGVLSSEQAHLVWQRAIGLLGDRERSPEGREVLDLAMARGISAYDAQFVSVAESLDVPLVTGDRRLVARMGGKAVAMEAFAMEAG